MKGVCLAVAVIALGACGRSRGIDGHSAVPARLETPGDALLRMVPTDADLVLEVDLRRLRDNKVVGRLLSAFAPPKSVAGRDLLTDADVAVLCVYDIGDAPRQLVLVKKRDTTHLEGARRLSARVWAVGDSELLNRAEAVATLAEPSVVSQESLMTLRARAMPDKAASASVRLFAALDFQAQVAIASKLNVSDVPVAIALWADVEDDLAVVLQLHVEKVTETQRLWRAVTGLRTSLSRHAFLQYIGFAPSLRRARVTSHAKSVQVTLLLSPKRLQLVTKRIAQNLLGPAS